MPGLPHPQQRRLSVVLNSSSRMLAWAQEVLAAPSTGAMLGADSAPFPVPQVQ